MKISIRAEIRKLIATLPAGTEFDYTLVKHLKSGNQALGDLKDLGEVIYLRTEKIGGSKGPGRSIYIAAPKKGSMHLAKEALVFTLGGNFSMKLPKGKVTIHRCL